VFVAIAKEIFRRRAGSCWAGRTRWMADGRCCVRDRTMFEYLMPSLWLRSYPNTLLERARTAAVRSQQAYAARRGVPWGISESAYSKLDDAGNYQYYAFGLPHLALRKRETKAFGNLPYSTFLSLNTDPEGAIGNLRRMAAWGGLEATAFTNLRILPGRGAGSGEPSRTW